LFFALWPDPAARTALAHLQAGLRPEIRARWLRPEQLHLTLACASDAGARARTSTTRGCGLAASHRLVGRVLLP